MSTPDDESGEGLDKTTLRPGEGEVARRHGYRLLVIGEHEHTAHRLPTLGDVSIGRSEAADIRVGDPMMSRVHAVFHMGPRIEISDPGSSNGTIVRGEKIPANQRVPLSVGDTVEVGGTVAIVQPDFARGTDVEQTGSGMAAVPEDAGEAMHRVYKLARRIAPSQINVLLLGETGVGKEVMAQRIHDGSRRAGGPFVGINCAAVGETLFESELFGYEKGAFTGASQAKPGLIETADGGTVFLDEVGEMPLSTQAKLLRVLEAREVMRVGGLKARPVDVRFVAATNQDLETEVAAGRFREDLYYRLGGITLVIPPLRDRLDELQGLARGFIDQACKDAGFPAKPMLSSDALGWMQAYTWPGNIRELRNAINRAVLLASGGMIQPQHLKSEAYSPRRRASGPVPIVREPSGASPAAGSDDDAERQRILDALAACAGNQTRAAKMLGIARRTLTARLDKLGIPRPRKGS